MIDFAKTEEEKKWRDAAYLVASSNSLCETLTYDQLQEIVDEDLMSVAWEPFENWNASDLHAHIAQIASNVYDAIERAVNTAREHDKELLKTAYNQLQSSSNSYDAGCDIIRKILE